MKVSEEDINKANKKGNRESELELTNGFPIRVKIFKNKKKYNRKKKHRNELD